MSATGSTGVTVTPPQRPSVGRIFGQMAFDTAVPFARAVEYGLGKEMITGEKIDRGNFDEILRLTGSVGATALAGIGAAGIARGASLASESASYLAWGALPLAAQSTWGQVYRNEHPSST